MKGKTRSLCFDKDRVSKEFSTSVETQHALILRNSICFKIKLISGRYAESERCM
jgi:hypothetical protein